MKTFKDYLLEETMTLPLAKEVLALTGAYTTDDVKKAYQVASTKHHPDKGGDVEMMKKVNVAYKMLKSTTGVSGKGIVDWDAIAATYKKHAAFVEKDLKSKFKPEVFSNYFEKIFGQKFNVTTTFSDSSKIKSPSSAGLTTEFKTEDGKIAFDLNVSVYLPNLEKQNKGLSTNENLSYPMGITAYGYANSKKQKMSKRDYNSKIDHSLFTDPSMIYPEAILKKMTKAAPSDKKMTKADFLLGLEKEVDVTNWNKADGVYLVNLKDGFVMIRRSVIMRVPVWSTMGIGEKKGQFGFDTKIRIYKSYPENKASIDLFKKLNGVSQQAAEGLLTSSAIK